MEVGFTDLTYTVNESRWKRKGRQKTILKSVSGRFMPGQLSAIMGHSGAGKSSLLNALSGYTKEGVRGSLLADCQERDTQVFARSSCYITQVDVLQPLMTVMESMVFAARLKLRPDTTEQERLDMVTEIVNTLGLTEALNTMTELLSGGQKKKLSVALELLNNPPVLFLDEPTSGLDNVSAKHCLQMLKKLSQQGRTIICSIHQPSASLFELLDHVYVLSRGLCVYQGSTSGLLSFLSTTGLPCPKTHNPADFVIEVTNGENLEYITMLKTATNNGKCVWKETMRVDDDTHRDQLSGTDSTKEQRNQSVPSHVKRQCQFDLDFPISTFSQFSIILSRMMLQFFRNRTALFIQAVHHVTCAVMIGILWFGSGNDGDKWFMHLKCGTAIIVFHSYTWMLIPILTYPAQTKILKREFFNRWYSFNAYYFALTLSTVPSMVFFSTVFLLMVYGMWGLPSELLRVAAFCLIGVAVSVAAEGLGYIIGCTFSLLNGSAVGPAMMAAFLGLAVYGFDFAQSIPLWVNVLMQISFMRNGVVALIVTVFGMGRTKMECTDVFGYCLFQDPGYFLKMGDLEKTNVWFEILKIVGLLVLFRIIFYVALRRRLKV